MLSEADSAPAKPLLLVVAVRARVSGTTEHGGCECLLPDFCCHHDQQRAAWGNYQSSQCWTRICGRGLKEQFDARLGAQLLEGMVCVCVCDCAILQRRAAFHHPPLVRNCPHEGGTTHRQHRALQVERGGPRPCPGPERTDTACVALSPGQPQPCEPKT